MNSILGCGWLIEMHCGSNFSYVLNDNSNFSSTEYKVLLSQENSCFIKCMKMLYNGKVQLFYLTNSYKPLSAMLSVLDGDSFLTIVANLLADIIDVKHNGFLSCQNIDISWEHIYVDPATYKVSLVYLPLGKKIYDDNSMFENELRTGLIKLISSIATLSSPKTLQFATDLSNGMLSLEDLYSRIKGGKSPVRNIEAPVRNESIQDVPKSRMTLTAMDAPTRVEIDVTKASFVIGKNATAVDGVISFNKMISRIHCRIDNQRGQYTITDLQSANGTYINRVRLQPNVPQSVKNGDIVRLANSDFQVTIM